MGRPRKYSDELRRRAIDEVIERDRKVPDVAKQLGITSPETLRRWVVQARIDRGMVTGPTTEELAEIKALRGEVADQQRTIEMAQRHLQGRAHQAPWPVADPRRHRDRDHRVDRLVQRRPPFSRSPRGVA